MQITLVQTEIETAIRNYIHSQIVVKDGMKIDIILKATRGDEGTTAIIDITPENQATTPTPVVAPALTAIQKKVSTPVPPIVKVEEPKQEPVAEPEPESAAESVPVVDVDPVPAPKAPTQVDEPASEAESDSEDAAPRKSLFSGLSKPKNS